MTIRDLYAVTFDRVTIYHQTGLAEFQDLFTGTPKETPPELLNKQIRVFGAKENGILDIEIVL